VCPETTGARKISLRQTLQPTVSLRQVVVHERYWWMQKQNCSNEIILHAIDLILIYEYLLMINRSPQATHKQLRFSAYYLPGSLRYCVLIC
jgi:hypothetical protein